jgi:hypothetical protein
MVYFDGGCIMLTRICLHKGYPVLMGIVGDLITIGWVALILLRLT